MDFPFCIRSISIAHAFVLDAEQRCAYPEGRGQYGAVYATEGEAEYRFTNGMRHTVCAGEFLFLSKNAAYTVHIPRIFRHFTVNFDLAEGSVPPLPLRADFCVMPVTDPAYAHLFARIAALWRIQHTGNDLAAMACLYEILALAVQDGGARADASRHACLMPAREYLGSHFCEAVSNADLAALCNMSETNFRREWARAYGGTPLSYRDALRMEQAKRLLLQAELSVGGAARECGFEDESYFGRFFKKHAGETPGEFRRRFAIL